jgi:hypothetical protein
MAIAMLGSFPELSSYHNLASGLAQLRNATGKRWSERSWGSWVCSAATSSDPITLHRATRSNGLVDLALTAELTFEWQRTAKPYSSSASTTGTVGYTNSHCESSSACWRTSKRIGAYSSAAAFSTRPQSSLPSRIHASSWSPASSLRR